MPMTSGLRAHLILFSLCIVAGCTMSDGSGLRAAAPPSNGQLFTLLPSSVTGVRFVNRLTDSRELNVFTYRNYYNGGGVALGDLTGDGLPEILLTSNLGGNRLYLNEGGFRFRDVTEDAGVGGKGIWATGATFADINADGLLDIYVCYAGNVEGKRRANELYIHGGVNADGVPTFTEQAAAHGLADEGYSTHAAFFDYDADGALDLYLVNNSFRPVGSFGLRNTRHVRDELGGDRLYHNERGRFVDVSAAAGIYGSEIGFGLGVAVSDVNRDGRPDIYVSNDFFERDYLYLNDGDGTFTESLPEQMPSISQFSMGLDIADIDDDGWPDVYVTDMLPEDDRRLKLMSSFEGWDVYQAKLKNGYHHQFMRNMLHLNNGNGTFSDIGQMAGVAQTDWSWSALIADFDLDGRKDIYVTNGLARDVTSQDYIAFLANTETVASATRGRRVDFLRLVEAMSSTPLPNYVFRNDGHLAFTNQSAAWGLNTPSFSNGAAYGDLDGDGAIDLVVNNVNQEAFVYRNNARTLLPNRYLQIVLDGDGPNRRGIGSKVTLGSGDTISVQEVMPSRGFQSSVDYVLTFGLGQRDTIESVTVEWPDGRVSALTGVAANQRLTVRQSAASVRKEQPASAAPPLFVEETDLLPPDVKHRENAFVDFDRERLMPRMLSTEGPAMAVADVNGDRLDDAYIGGAKDQAGTLLLQQPDGRFLRGSAQAFEQDRISEDVGAVFFDADGDGDPDLYVVSGGSEFSDMAPALQDRLYLNDGRGAFRKALGHLPPMNISGSRAAVADFDRDGDVDLFVGGRVVPWRYGTDPASVLLRNDGRGHFTDVTEQVAPGLSRIGMVTDALWQDADGDGRSDLVVVGEWMPIEIFRSTPAGTLERWHPRGLEKSHGWWNRIVAGDFTGDGRIDFVVGNVGLNLRLRASEEQPVTMHVKDFDGNGFNEQILAHYGDDGRSYPFALRDDLIKALPSLKARYLSYESYAGQTLSDVFPASQLDGAVFKQAFTFASTLVVNDGAGSFTLVPLPREAQLAPIYGLQAGDFDRDGNLDLLLAGNIDGVKPEIGRLSAGYGLFLRGDGRGMFDPIRATESGFLVPGQARDIQRVRTRHGELYAVTRNNDRPVVFRAAPAVVASAPRQPVRRTNSGSP